MEHSSPIFVGGCPSSGTTLLRAILDSHSAIACGPELAIFDRAFIYTQKYSRFRALIEVTPIILEYPFHVKGNSRFHVNTLSLVLELCEGARTASHFCPNTGETPTNIFSYVESWDEVISCAKQHDDYVSFFDALLGGYAARQGKQRWAEKSPENICYARQSLDLFPNSVFISMMRHPFDTVASMVFRNRNPFPLERALARLAESLRGRARCLGDDRFYEVRYEQLITQPQETIADMMRFLGHEGEPDQLAFHIKERPGTGEYATTPIFNTSIGRWKRDLDDATIAAINDVLESENAALGYDLEADRIIA